MHPGKVHNPLVLFFFEVFAFDVNKQRPKKINHGIKKRNKANINIRNSKLINFINKPIFKLLK